MEQCRNNVNEKRKIFSEEQPYSCCYIAFRLSSWLTPTRLFYYFFVSSKNSVDRACRTTSY